MQTYKILKRTHGDLRRQKDEGVNSSNRALSTKVDGWRTVYALSALSIWGEVSFPKRQRGANRIYCVVGEDFMPMLDISLGDVKSYIDMATPCYRCPQEGIFVWMRPHPLTWGDDLWCLFVMTQRSAQVPELTKRVTLRIFIDRQHKLLGKFILALVSHDSRGQEVVRWQFVFFKNLSILSLRLI